MVNPTTVRASLRVKDLRFAAFPAVRTTDLLERIRPLFPQLIPLRDLLHVTFLYTNAVHHPPATICNAGRIEDTAGNYLHYYEGITPSVGRVIDAVDLERRSVAQAYYVDTPTFVDRFFDMGYTTEEARRTGLAYEAFHASEPDRWIQAPASLVHRFLDEDVPYGLVPLAALARVAQIRTPNIDALIQIASTLRGVDYLAEGMGVDRLGIANLSHGDLQSVLWEGFR
jgi:opine dehydrogenase